MSGKPQEFPESWKTEHRCDVAIAGASLGGCFLARLLGEAGHSVIVVEPGPGIGRQGPEFLKARGIRVLGTHGLLEPLLAKGALRRKSIEYYHDGAPILHFDFGEHTDLGYCLIAPYSEIMDTVIAGCEQYDNVRFMFGSAVSSLDLVRRGVRGLLLGSRAAIRARVFVGASHEYSPIGSYVARSSCTISYDHTMLSALIAAQPSMRDCNRLYFSSSGGFAYLHPLTTGAARIIVGVPRISDARRRDKCGVTARELGKFVTKSDDALAELDLARFSSWPAKAFQAASYCRDNAVLLGSAAFACHPMTGLGVSYTLEDADLLADAINLALQRGADAGEILSSQYAPRWDDHARLIGYGTDLAASYRDPDEYLKNFQPTLHGGDM